MLGATGAQSIYYLPKSDLAATAIASPAVVAGSARDYGTQQSMGATEMMVDEIAEMLDLDPIEFRLRNVLKSGMKNTQGAVPAGAVRADEILERARAHPLWTGRAARKKRLRRRPSWTILRRWIWVRAEGFRPWRRSRPGQGRTLARGPNRQLCT
jgi:CO/xanthine dehydrogenase Mo-binding subunit